MTILQQRALARIQQAVTNEYGLTTYVDNSKAIEAQVRATTSPPMLTQLTKKAENTPRLYVQDLNPMS